MATISAEVAGMEAAQAAMVRAVKATEAKGKLGKVIRDATVELHAYARLITDRDTGTLAAAHYMRFTGNATGEIYINPSARNPRSKTPPSEYGLYESNRGGRHAFYRRTVTEKGPSVMNQAISEIKQAIG